MSDSVSIAGLMIASRLRGEVSPLWLKVRKVFDSGGLGLDLQVVANLYAGFWRFFLSRFELALAVSAKPVPLFG